MAGSTHIRALLLDSWPVLEWLKGRKPSGPAFRTLIESAFAGDITFSMSRMNYGEVLYSIKKDMPADLIASATRAFLELPIAFYSIDDRLVDEAAVIKAKHPISYADCFAVALALRLKIPLVTGDPELRALKAIGVELLWLGA